MGRKDMNVGLHEISSRPGKGEELGESAKCSSLSVPLGFERIQPVGCWEA